MVFENTLSFAQQLDRDDPLRSFRSRFLIPLHGEREALYFLGNSLGLQPKDTGKAIQQVLDEWQALGVESFFKGNRPWLGFHRQLQPTLAAIVGARPNEVVAMNSLTVNLHLMLVSFYQPSGRRKKILCEAKAFPSDQYMLHTHVRQRGLDPGEVIVEVSPRSGEVTIRNEDILAAIATHKDDLALVFWGGVNYYTGQVFDMERVAEAAHAAGAKIGLDLAHAVGNVPLQLHDWDVDFASWCTYKYLNAGPGAIGGAYIHERYHADASLNRFAGWWGNKKETQFLMEKTFEPEESAEGWQLSTPSPVLYAAHKAALDLFAEAGIEAVFAKNRNLNNYLWLVLDQVAVSVPPGAFTVFTPEEKDDHGCQVSLSVSNGRKVFEAISQEGVFADWREPDVIRFAPVGLYNQYEDVYQFGQILQWAIRTFAQ